MSLSITNIILRLENLRLQQFNGFKSIDQLIHSLKELDSIVEMKAAKESICLQLQYIIMKIILNPNSNELFDDHMLHTVISGPPGVGKTHLGKILAQIWNSLGILKGKPKNPEIPQHLISQYNSLHQSINAKLRQAADNLDEPLRKINGYVHYYNDAYAESIHKAIQSHKNTIHDIIKENILPTSDLKSDDLPFRITTRADFIGKFVGHTAPKTKEVLESCIGGVLFIDEAYSLFTSDNDSFGMEALTEINRFMSEYPRELIIIFAGYRDLIENTIFKAQPGLKRRCSWVFEIESYTPAGLSLIFKQQLEQDHWHLHPDVDCIQFFTQNYHEFKNFGGDTYRLVFYCKLYHMHNRFMKLTEKPFLDKKRKSPQIQNLNVITQNTLTLAFHKYKENKTTQVNTSDPPFGMYI